MDVYLMRHAHAVERGEWGWFDETRPLTEKGRLAAGAVAEGLARESPPISRIISSPYARALETATIVTRRLGLSVTVDPRLTPGFQIGLFFGVVVESHATGSLLLIGHEPDLGGIVTGIARERRHPITFKKATVVLLRLPSVTPQRAAPGWHNLSELLAGAALVWLRTWREWEGLAGE